MPAAAGSAQKDIVDTAVAAGTFNTLATALQVAGLADTLKGKGPFTVFASTDEAFSKLPAGTVESLFKPENKDKLKAILLYHVVSGDVTAAQVVKLSSAKTINGQDLKLTVNDGTVMVNWCIVHRGSRRNDDQRARHGPEDRGHRTCDHARAAPRDR